MLCFGNGPRSHREEVQRFIRDEAAPIPKLRSIDGFDSLVTLVAAGQGISMFPKVLDLSSQGIIILPIASKAVFEFRMWAVWKRDSPSQLLRHFIELLKESV
jgi:DNA-binding transcriptional LysR family regulator